MTPETALQEVEARPVILEMPEEAKEQQRNVDTRIDSMLFKLDELNLEARQLADQMEGSAVQQEVLQAISLAPKEQRIRSHTTYTQGWECLRSIQYAKKRLDETLGMVISRAYDLHKLLNGARTAVEQPAKDCKTRLVEQISKWFLWLLANWRQQQEEFPDEAAVLKLRKMPGGSVTPTFGAEVRDKLKLVTFVAAHPEYEHYLSANMSALNKVASGEQTAMSIPGVTLIPKVTVRVNAWK